jgi:hypothetical protein
MGVSNLWQVLKAAGLVTQLPSPDGGGLAGRDAALHIARAVDGKTIAVDLSIWLFEASKQVALASSLHRSERV